MNSIKGYFKFLSKSLKKKYLFIYLAASGLSCSKTGMWAPEHVGSVVAAFGLSCPMCMGS